MAAQSVATGPALVQGMAGVVYEQQTVTATGTDGGFSVRLTQDGELSASISADIASDNVATDADFKAAIESIAGEVSKSGKLCDILAYLVQPTIFLCFCFDNPETGLNFGPQQQEVSSPGPPNKLVNSVC